MAENTVPDRAADNASSSTYLTFEPYPLQIGQKIYITNGPRRGDWQVIGLSERKVRLRCPFSGREVEWDRFCYLVEESNGQWPHPD